ncbi:methyltransferase domain-containing protein [Xylariaceae sp. FL0804]|nr:methyltransferase domain-containing protein [Xylariaceae sp. FL0804]
MAASSSASVDETKARLRDSYDAIAGRYNAWTTTHSAQRLAYLDRALGHLNLNLNLNQNHPLPLPLPQHQPWEEEHDEGGKGLRVLELGCGAGLPVTKALLGVRGVARVIANDLSGAQIRLAGENLRDGAGDDYDDDGDQGGQRRRPQLELVEGDMTKLAFEDGSLDLVLGFYSVIHLPREEQTEMIARIVRWLSPGGLFLANFGVEAAEAQTLDKWLGEDKGWMFWSGWGKDGTLKVLREAGLEILMEEVKEDVDDATFLWVLAKKPSNTSDVRPSE